MTPLFFLFFNNQPQIPVQVPSRVHLGLAPTQNDIQTVLRAFLLSILDDSVPVIEGQDNRLPEPSESDFVVFWPIRRLRLATNIDSQADTFFTGSISGTTLTATKVFYGTLGVGQPVFGPDVTFGTRIVDGPGTGNGGAGTYTITPAQNVSQQAMAAGQMDMIQETEITFQLDVHGPNSADNAQIISTAFRDNFAVEFFVAANPLITPLFADDPKQIPFINDQSQYEDRWIIEAHLQADQTVIVPQQFADTLVVIPVDVDVAFPA